MANFLLAFEGGLTIIPVINKVRLMYNKFRGLVGTIGCLLYWRLEMC